MPCVRWIFVCLACRSITLYEDRLLVRHTMLFLMRSIAAVSDDVDEWNALGNWTWDTTPSEPRDIRLFLTSAGITICGTLNTCVLCFSRNANASRLFLHRTRDLHQVFTFDQRGRSDGMFLHHGFMDDRLHLMTSLVLHASQPLTSSKYEQPQQQQAQSSHQDCHKLEQLRPHQRR